MSVWLPTETEHALLQHVIDVNGEPRQLVKAAEEFAELATAMMRTLRHDRTPKDIEALAGELADAEIMHAQLQKIYPQLTDLVSKQRGLKLAVMAFRFGFPGVEEQSKI